MMASIKDKRKRIEEMVLKTIGTVSKRNEEYYREFFKSMDDDDFTKFMNNLKNNPKMFITLEAIPFEDEPDIKDVIKACKQLGIKLFDHVVMPYKNPDGEPVVSKYPAMIIYLNIRRLQQMISKKNTMSIHVDQRNPKTGQVISSDKNSRNTDVENISLLCMGLDKTIQEFMGPKADDIVAKNAMQREIQNKGYVSLNSLPNDIENKTALNTLNAYLLAAGIRTDLVNNSLLLNQNIDTQDHSSVARKYEKE